MKTKLIFLGVGLSLFFSTVLWSNNEKDSLDISIEEMQMLLYLDSLEKTMNYERGEINIGDGIAALHLPEAFKYLNPEQSAFVLSDFWGNPPSETLGLIFPEGATIYDSGTYAIEITYDEMGYINDDDAKEINYDDLLKEMKKDTEEANKYRIENDYPSIELVNWASPPFYDNETKKLHWAKELKFGGEEENVLNYAIRVLGRKGVMELNFISSIENLESVKADIPKVLSSINFNSGYKYSDFNSSIDKVAAVGIVGLIAGKILTKGGFLVMLAKFWKIIALGFVAFFGIFGKFFKGLFDKKEETV